MKNKSKLLPSTRIFRKYRVWNSLVAKLYLNPIFTETLSLTNWVLFLVIYYSFYLIYLKLNYFNIWYCKVKVLHMIEITQGTKRQVLNWRSSVRLVRMHFAVSISKPDVTLNQRIFHVVAYSYWNWWYSWCNLFESVFDVIYHTIFHSTTCSTKSGKYTLLTLIPVWFFLSQIYPILHSYIPLIRVALTTWVCMRMKYVTTCSTDIDELTDFRILTDFIIFL